MSRSDTGNRGTGDIRVAAVTAPLASAAHVSQAGQRLRILGALAGITGPVLLAAYFSAPALTYLSAGFELRRRGEYLHRPA